jgi:hypothetical protein
MYVEDDRLAGDPVWELFPKSGPGPSEATAGRRLDSPWAWGACAAVLVVLGLVVFPPLAVATAALAVAWKDFVRGRRIARFSPDRAVGMVSSRFTYGWGLWKLGMAAVVLMFVAVAFVAKEKTPPSGFVAAALLVMLGFTGSAVATASGLYAAFKNGLRVWVGEGVNQARTLLKSMLLVAFVVGILMPSLLMIPAPGPRGAGGEVPYFLFWIFGMMFGAPVVLLVVLDWMTRRVVADRPGKFDTKVPTVGKWSS